MTTIWKQIPIKSLEHLEISECGEIRDRQNYCEYTQYEYGNNYKYILICIDGIDKRYSIHRLVAITYLPLPEDKLFSKYAKKTTDGVPYIVNHKDCNKQNNHYSNLEWCDASHNCRHAIENNKNPATCRVKVHDLLTNTIKVYGSKSDLSRELGIKQNLDIIIHNFKTIPYKSRYLFDIISYDVRAINKIVDNDKNIYCLDYINRACIIYDTSVEAEKATGIIANSIKSRCTINAKGEYMGLLGGYDFHFLKHIDTANLPVFKDYTKEEAVESKRQYLYNIENGLTSYMKSVIYINKDTGEMKRCNSLKELSKILNTQYYRLKNSVSKGNKKGIDRYDIDGTVFYYG